LEFTADITAGPEVISAVKSTWLLHPLVWEVGSWQETLLKMYQTCIGSYTESYRKSMQNLRFFTKMEPKAVPGPVEGRRGVYGAKKHKNLKRVNHFWRSFWRLFETFREVVF
jgi:hypothetical protein